MTKKLASYITSKQTFAKQDVVDRTDELKEYCVKRWWADVPEGRPAEVFTDENEPESV